MRGRKKRAAQASSVIGGTGWQAAAQVVPLFANLALTPFVIHSLGPLAYGLWLISSTVTQFVAEFDGGISKSAQRFFSILAGQDDTRGSTRLMCTLLACILVLSCITFLPIFLFTPHLVEFFHAPAEYVDDMGFLLRVLVVLVAIGLARNVFAVLINARSLFKITAGTMLLGYVVYALGMVYTLNAGYGLRGVAYVFIVQQLVATLLIVPSAARFLDVRAVGFVTGAELREFWQYAWKSQLAGLLFLFSQQGVLLIVGRMAPRQVSSFGPGSTFAFQIRMLALNALVPIEASLGRSVGAAGLQQTQAEFERVQRAWVQTITGLFFVAAPAAFFGVNLWLPLETDLAGAIAAILLVAHFLAMLPQPLVIWALLAGRPGMEIWMSATSVVLLISGCLVLVPLVGAWGAAVAAVGAQLAGLVAISLAARGLGGKIPNPIVAVPWVPGLLAAAVAFGGGWGITALANQGYWPAGGLGLLSCGLFVAPALMLYATLVLGPTQARRFFTDQVLGRVMKRFAGAR